MLKEKVVQAYNFAKEKHGNQKRRFSNLPAFSHPKAAARIVEQLTNDEDLVAAALLHDTIEDTATTLQEIKDKFGERVAGLVDEVTSKAEERGFRKKKDYLYEKVRKMSQDALTIKMADRLHNLMFLERDGSSIPSLYQKENPDFTSDIVRKAFTDFVKYYVMETHYVFDGLTGSWRWPDLNQVNRALYEQIQAVLTFLTIMHKL